jgi:hypothetical protein
MAPSQPNAEFDFNFNDSELDEWKDAFIADAEAEAVQQGEEEQFHGDPEKAAILASFNVHCFRRLREDELEEINDANLEHVVEISPAGGHGGGMSPHHGG